MGARAVLDDLRGAGVSVKLVDDKLIVGPKDRLTDPLRDAIREHRDELVLALKAAPPAAAPVAPPSAGPARIYRLTRQHADEAHAEPWDSDTIAMFNLRRDAIRRRGYDPDDAEDLAERLARRDAQRDDLRMCVECTHLAEHGRCLAAAAGRILGADRRLEPDPVTLQRCTAFGLRTELSTRIS
jgi:hypothetical protein